MQLRTSAILCAALLGLAACKRPEPPLTAPAAPGIADRVEVLSADTLVVDGRHIRLSNGFAPEPIPQARCWAEALAARQTTQVVVEMVRAAHAITVQPTGGADEYARTYSTVALDGVDLGQTLVDDGLAGRPPSGRFEWCDPISRNGAGAPSLRALMAPPR